MHEEIKQITQALAIKTSSPMTRTILFFHFGILSIYCYGAGMMDYFAIYFPWKLIDSDDFPAFHQYQGQFGVSIFVIPSAIMTLFNIASLIFPPSFIARKWLLYSLIAYSFDWIFSFTMQIPIQLELQKRKDDALINELIRTNWWRFAADTLQFVIVCIVLWNLLKKLQLKTSRSKRASFSHAQEVY